MSEQIFKLTPFVGGLNTEYSTVEDLPQCTSDELNCTIYAEGVRGRRLGMNEEREGETVWTQLPRDKMVSSFLWKNVNKTNRDFIVVVNGQYVLIWQAEGKPFSKNPVKWSAFSGDSEAALNIEDYIVSEEYYNNLVNFSTGDGKLMMVNSYMKPLILSYDEIKDSFTFEEISLKIRDFDGLEDGVKPGDRKETLTNNHKYNLLNQGWRIAEIEQFYTDKKYYPDNTFRWFIGKDDSGKFNTDKMLQTYFGNTPAPKGHFILDYFDRDRAAASGIYSASARSGSFYAKYWTVRNGGFENKVGLPKAGIKQSIITLTNSKGTVKSATIKIKKNLIIGGKRITKDYHGQLTFKIQGLNNSNKWVTISTDSNYFYGKGTYTISVQNNETKYKQHRLVTTLPDADNANTRYKGSMELDMNVQMSLAEDGDPFPHTSSQKFVTDIAYMANKYFYLSGNTLLFSQSVTDSNKGYGNCYQDADPTSEDISDLLETDGGYVKFETMGDGVALKTFNRGVLVFGRDVVWGLVSPADGVFTATAYDIVELSKAGIIGDKSAVAVADNVFYWSPLGIFKIGVNVQTGSTLVAQNISQNTIQTYYNNIPVSSKRLCRGVFDYVNNRIYWYYPTDADSPTKLDGCLVYDLTYNAFMPFKISTKYTKKGETPSKYLEESSDMVSVFETVEANEIEPSMFLYAGENQVITSDEQAVVVNEQTNKYNRFTAIQHVMRKYSYDHFYSGSSVFLQTLIGFCDYNSRDYIDWGSESYDSYMVSRPIMWESFARTGNILSGTYNNKQVPVLQTLFKRTEEDCTTVKGKYIAQSGAFIRLRWGWSLSDKSNRWDIVQDAYRPQKDFMEHEYVESRVHVRGRGKSFQVEVRNDGNKDFRLAAINLKVRSK